MELIDYVNEHAKFLTKKLAENWTVENRKELFKVLSDLEKFEAKIVLESCSASNQSKDLGIRSISQIDWKELAKSVKSEKLSQIDYGIKKVQRLRGIRAEIADKVIERIIAFEKQGVTSGSFCALDFECSVGYFQHNVIHYINALKNKKNVLMDYKFRYKTVKDGVYWRLEPLSLNDSDGTDLLEKVK